MSELLPYEQELAGKLADIPLPDENPAWGAMRKMLDEDDDDGIIPPLAAGCRKWGLTGLLLLLAAGIMYFAWHKKADAGSRNAPVAKHGADSLAKPVSPPARGAATDTTGRAGGNGAQTAHKKDKTAVADVKRIGFTAAKTLQSIGDKNPKTVGRSKATKLQDGAFSIKTRGAIAVDDNKKDATTEVGRDSGRPVAGNGLSGRTVQASQPDKPGVQSNHAAGDTTLKTPTTPNQQGGRLKTDGANSPEGTGSIATPTPSNNNLPPAKKDTAAIPTAKGNGDKPNKIHFSEPDAKDQEDNPSKIYFSAGLGMQQLIPVDGQKATPYNAFGRKGSLADYIPSAYFRVHKNNAFLQVEFKYGAPQYTKNIAYSTQIINKDTATHITTSAVNHVQKTYYHQLPLSIHYTILPGFSFGAGAVLNKFESAVVNQQTHSTNTQTGIDSVVASKVISVKNDSAFAKVYWQFMLETQYSFKRFSLGVRYSWGLKPYLTYTPPGGQTQRERNASLNIFIRYDLWQQKKK